MMRGEIVSLSASWLAVIGLHEHAIDKLREPTHLLYTFSVPPRQAQDEFGAE